MKNADTRYRNILNWVTHVIKIIKTFCILIHSTQFLFSLLIMSKFPKCLQSRWLINSRAINSKKFNLDLISRITCKKYFHFFFSPWKKCHCSMEVLHVYGNLNMHAWIYALLILEGLKLFCYFETYKFSVLLSCTTLKFFFFYHLYF